MAPLVVLGARPVEVSATTRRDPETGGDRWRTLDVWRPVETGDRSRVSQTVSTRDQNRPQAFAPSGSQFGWFPAATATGTASGTAEKRQGVVPGGSIDRHICHSHPFSWSVWGLVYMFQPTQKGYWLPVLVVARPGST